MPRCGGSYISEEQYYDEIVASLRQNLLVYPYHFSEYLMTRERAQLSPFDYYLEMIAEARRRRLQRRRAHPALARESIGGRCSRAGERTTASPTSRLRTSCGCSASAGTSTSKSSTASGARARAHTGARSPRSLARHPRARLRLQFEGVAQEAARSVDIRRAAVAPRRRAHRVLVEGAACARVARGIQEVRPTGSPRVTAATSARGLGQVRSAAAGNDLNNSRESLAPRRRRRGGALGPDDSAPAVLQGAGVRGGAESTVRTAAQLSQAAQLSRAAQLSHAAWYHTAWYLAAQLSSGHSAARHGCAMLSAARRCRSTTMTRSRSRRCRTSS